MQNNLRKSKTVILKSISILLLLSIISLSVLTSCNDTPAEKTQSDDATVQTEFSDVNYLNGPYLLAPKSNSMVVSWECDKPATSKISYSKDEQNWEEAEVAPDAGEEYNGEPMHIYRAYLENLEPDTEYSYKVSVNGGEEKSGKFKTLKDNPEEYKFVVLSDSHRFDIAKQFGEMLETEKPDFILHTGDLVEGTGGQKEQFVSWFNNDGGFLNNYPVVYAMGNHDYGPYINEYAMDVQSAQYHSGPNGDISFNYGPIHFTIMNSNPWGLLEMNADSSNMELDSSVRESIDGAMQWLDEDLKSEEAKNSKFRILSMHHPYLDDYTSKYVVPVAEENNVNLMFAGHLHKYNRNASINPDVGLEVMYITQGDARVGDNSIKYGEIDERVNEDFPEVLATGKSDWVVVSVSGDSLVVDNYGVNDEDKAEVVESVEVYNEEANLEYSDVEIDKTSILSNDSVMITAKVTNKGKGLAAASIKVNDNGEDRYLYLFGKEGKERVVELKAGDSEVLTAPLKLTELGTHKLKIGDDEKSVEVNFREATFDVEKVRTRLGNEEKYDRESDILNVKADVTNIGNESGTMNAVLYVDGEAVDSKSVEFTEGEQKTVDFQHVFDKYGQYNIKVNDSKEVEIEIEGTLEGMPIVKDLSGNGNDGYIHGAPKLVKYDKGYGIALDGERDYLEIPDRSNYKIEDEYSAIIWSNITRLANEDEEDHNPLLVKGVSLSYGTNYLFRMAMRSFGKLTYGTCFDNENGEYHWTDEEKEGLGARLGDWTQYSATFSRNTGGVSYQNKEVSGSIDAPPFDSEILNWEGAPMYSGYSYCRQFMPGRGRGKSYTMLTAEIGEIRFYTKSLSDTEIAEIYENPSSEGPEKDNLAIWLDFAPDNIVTAGKHTTEWRALNDKQSEDQLTSIAYSADIPEGASINITVEVSDDKSKAKVSEKFTLENGEGKIDLSKIDGGKYVRIISELGSKVAEDSTDIPVLKEYTVSTASGENLIWATMTHWNNGEIEGAVGHQTPDMYKKYTQDYDEF